MSAHINLEDAEDGAINFRVVFSPLGFNKDSAAHQHAQIVVKFLDTILTQAGPPEKIFIPAPAESSTPSC